MSKHLAAFFFFVALALVSFSQPTGERNTAVTVTELSSYRLPARIDAISLFADQIHFVAGGMLLTTPPTGAYLQTPMVDTTLAAIDPELTYAISDPISGQLYYTKNDSKGRSQLYVYYEKKPGKFTSRRIKLPGLNSSVSHPVFSSDGRAMVFVSDSPVGFGGADLWFSLRNGEEWQTPQNMDHHINSGGDEIMPAIYGDYLIFSSNGRSDSYGGFDLYAARLVALTQGDTVEMYPIGRAPAFSLQAPFCTNGDDLGFIVSSDLSSGWWLRRGTDSSETLCHFAGRLDCVNVKGMISSSLYDKVEDAYAVAAFTPRPGAPLRYDTVPAYPDGSYSLYLRPGVPYELFFHAANHFVTHIHYAPARANEEQLYVAAINDVRLNTIALDSLISTKSLFSSSVSSELSPAGRAFVDNLARFLVENPNLSINIYSTYNLSADIPFCSLLNGSRLRSLTNYLVSKGVSPKAIATSTNRPASLKRASQSLDDRNLSPVAQSSLTVGFSFSSK